MQALELMRRMVDGKLLHPDLDVKKIIRSDGELAPEDILFIPISFYSYKHIWTYGMYYDGFHIIPEIRGLSTDIREVNARSIAINSNSQYKGEACEFIKLFLSEEVQYKLSESNDLPVNKKADEKSMADMLRETNEIPPEWYRPTEKDIGHLKGYMAKINKISSYDQELDKLIWNEIEKYMKNEKSVEETAKAVQNKVELYLNE